MQFAVAPLYENISHNIYKVSETCVYLQTAETFIGITCHYLVCPTTLLHKLQINNLLLLKHPFLNVFILLAVVQFIICSHDL
jgi:hypothetical protein